MLKLYNCNHSPEGPAVDKLDYRVASETSEVSEAKTILPEQSEAAKEAKFLELADRGW